MYKWHLSSAIGHGRLLHHDFSRAADGIAASLRQFSISASRAFQNDELPRKPRIQRSADAINEISSLAPGHSKGVDARSLAARPPQGFTIRRVDETTVGRNNATTRGRGAFRGRGEATRGGSAYRGRGGGAAAGRGRGGGGKRRRAKPMKQIKKEEDSELPWSIEEIEWMDTGHQLAWAKEYTPETSAESLAKWMPAVASGAAGQVQSVMYKMEVATGNVTRPLRHATQHLERMSSGNGMTLFESDEARAVTQAFKDQKRRAIAEKRGKEFVPEKIGSLSKEQQIAMLKSWIGGHYDAPKTAAPTDTLGQVESFARRNETYLPDDTRKLQAKVRSLIPATSALKPASIKAASTP